MEPSAKELKAAIADLMKFVYEISECYFLGDGEYECPWKENEPPQDRASRLFAKYEKIV